MEPIFHTAASFYAFFALGLPLMTVTQGFMLVGLERLPVRRAIPLAVKLLAVGAIIGTLIWSIEVVWMHSVLDGWEFKRFILSPRNHVKPVALTMVFQLYVLPMTRMGRRWIRDAAD